MKNESKLDLIKRNIERMNKRSTLGDQQYGVSLAKDMAEAHLKQVNQSISFDTYSS